MKKAVIWDLDGTLLDSYAVIVDSIYFTFLEFGIAMTKEEIHQHTIRFSTKSLFRKMSEEYGLCAQEIQTRYGQISGTKYKEIRKMAQATEVLEALDTQGVENYVFTHRGKTTLPVLDHLKMTSFFRQILTSQSGFARKPDPEAIQYLIQKYALDPGKTWYVGDRAIDMECAKNAGISGILYLPDHAIDVSGGAESVIVKELMEIASIV